MLLLLLQGEYCLQMKMDILPGSGIAAVGAQTVAVPSAPQSITRQVRSSSPSCLVPSDAAARKTSQQQLCTKLSSKAALGRSCGSSS